MRVLAVIQRSAESLGRQIDDLLDIASIEAGRLALDPRPESPADIVARAVELSEAAARESRLELSIEVAPGLPLVCADAERVLQAIGNLVGNALKFTPPGGRVTMHAASGVRAVLFTVQDSGGASPPPTCRACSTASGRSVAIASDAAPGSVSPSSAVSSRATADV
jgi:signal transduction histidine kinase